MELKQLLAIYRRALLEVISIANLWVYLGVDQCCFLGSECDVSLRSLQWWFLVIAVCLLQAEIPGNLQSDLCLQKTQSEFFIWYFTFTRTTTILKLGGPAQVFPPIFFFWREIYFFRSAKNTQKTDLETGGFLQQQSTRHPHLDIRHRAAFGERDLSRADPSEVVVVLN